MRFCPKVRTVTVIRHCRWYTALMHTRPIFEFLGQHLRQTVPCALVTVVSVSGASTRNPGTHMAVTCDGRFVGSLSGGCIEVAVVAEAQAAIRACAPREIAFGAGAPYIDIRLPCGGRIDLLITPLSTVSPVDEALNCIRRRQPFTLHLSRTDAGVTVEQIQPRARLTFDETTVSVGHLPDLRMTILGHGASVLALAQQAKALGVESAVVSPDRLTLAQATDLGVSTRALKSLSETNVVDADAWTAAVFLFHDHDWESGLLAQALASSAFYVGAMGSLKTHAARVEHLRAAGVGEADLARIVAPIGLIPSSRDPETLALSILAQVVAGYHRVTQI